MTPVYLSRSLGIQSSSSERGLAVRRGEMSRLQEQMSTQKSVNRASDDPGAFSVARRMESLTNRLTQYQRSIRAAGTWVDSTQDALNGIVDQFAEAHELGLRAVSGTFNASDLESQAQRIESIIEETVSSLNAESDGEYIFGGSKTGTPPFAYDKAAGTISYAGDDLARQRQIGQQTRIAVNVSGQRIMDQGEAYSPVESLQSLVDAMRSGDNDAMRTALGQVETSQNHFIDLGAQAGSVAARLESADHSLEGTILEAESRRSDAEDLDFADAYMAFQKEQTALQAALSATAGILQTSIVNYLK